MTIALLELGLAGILAYSAIKCVQLRYALIGREEPGTHCTGSLIALIVGITGYGLSSFVKTLLTGVGIGAAARGILGSGGGAGSGGGGGGGGGGVPGQAPAPGPGTPEPSPPELPPSPELPALPPGIGAISSTTGPSSGAATVNGGDFTASSTPASATSAHAALVARLQLLERL